MKVIGQGTGNSYIVEMTPMEMANLCGFSKPSDHGLISLGAEIRITDLFLSLIRRKTHEKTIKTITDGLEQIIKDIQIVDPLQDIGDVS